MGIYEQIAIWLIALGSVTAGGIKAWELFSGAVSSKRDYVDSLDERTITRQRDMITALEVELAAIKKQSTEQHAANLKKIEQLTADYQNIQGKYDGLLQIFQGRDAQSSDMYALVKATHDNVERLAGAIESHLRANDKNLQSIAQKI